MATATASMQDVDTSNIEGNTPSQIKSVLLTDGHWYDVQPNSCKKIQYVVAESRSPIQSDTFYNYLKFQDRTSNRWMRVPFNQIVAFDTGNS